MGRAIRYNLFGVEYTPKSIFAPIPNAHAEFATNTAKQAPLIITVGVMNKPYAFVFRGCINCHLQSNNSSFAFKGMIQAVPGYFMRIGIRNK
ncbi:hypothetical protein EZS27_027575 [termite gut metagenome]|uniref:Uncharacterized protein n=1 Tax=termite gut metagenome TaxID=433724 RepID=A0A5J4QM41_9ZZZZ